MAVAAAVVVAVAAMSAVVSAASAVKKPKIAKAKTAIAQGAVTKPNAVNAQSNAHPAKIAPHAKALRAKVKPSVLCVPSNALRAAIAMLDANLVANSVVSALPVTMKAKRQRLQQRQRLWPTPMAAAPCANRAHPLCTMRL